MINIVYPASPFIQEFLKLTKSKILVAVTNLKVAKVKDTVAKLMGYLASSA